MTDEGDRFVHTEIKHAAGILMPNVATARGRSSAEYLESCGVGRRTVAGLDTGLPGRDSKYPTLGHRTFADAEWSVVLRAIRTGRLDR